MTARPRFVAAPPEHSADELEAASLGARQRAVRVVAALSLDVDDCRELLDMLGLHSDACLPGPDPAVHTQLSPPRPSDRALGRPGPAVAR